MSAGPPGAPPPPQPPSDPQPSAGARHGALPGQPGQQPAPPGPPGAAPSGPSPAYPQSAPPGAYAQQAPPGVPQDTPYPMPYDQPYNASGPQVSGGPATASGHAAVSGAFAAPAGGTWMRVSPRLAWYRRVLLLAIAIVVIIAGAFLAGTMAGLPAGIAIIASVLVVAIVAWLLAEFNYRSWGYIEQSDEFLMTHGVLVRRFLMVPYGRMQLVDVNANVLQQWFGIATVRLYTAAATTDARLPGIPRQEAERLRDRLVAKSEARSMGL